MLTKKSRYNLTTFTMIDILEIDNGVYVLAEKGEDVLSSDCISYGVTRADRRRLMDSLLALSYKILFGRSENDLIQSGVLKKLDRQHKTKRYDVWEVRDEGSHCRLIFLRLHPNMYIVSAVNKGHGSLTQAINRGIKRWELYLKTLKKLV